MDSKILFRYKFINYNIAISKETVKMSTFLDDLLKKMKTAPHVGVPSVTNPKLPTKVERDTAEYAARQKAMPNFKFGTGTPLERLQKHMVIAQHPTPTYSDPSFKAGRANDAVKYNIEDMDEWENTYQKFVMERKAKNKVKGDT